MKRYFNISFRGIEFAVIFGLLCAITMSMAHFSAACDDLRTNVLRMHIIANSDSEEDQRLKLMVRDRILEQSGGVFSDSTDLDSAIISASESISEFEKIANEVIKENGFKYTAVAEIGNSYFENRVYDDFTLPAGNYKSLIVRLGKAEGKNWWCVVFPSVCVPAAGKGELSDSTSKESASIAEQPQKYIMQFKAVEMYEDFKKLIKGK